MKLHCRECAHLNIACDCNVPVADLMATLATLLNCEPEPDIDGGWYFLLDGPGRHEQRAVLTIERGTWFWEFGDVSFQNCDSRALRARLDQWAAVVSRVHEAERVLRACEDLGKCTDNEAQP